MNQPLKSEARRRYRELRESIPLPERVAIDAAIANRVKELAEFASADVVFTYLSAGSEVDMRQIILAAWEAGKTVCVPRCVPGSNLMEWHRIDGFEGLERGSFGIEEPPADPATLVEPAAARPGMRAVALVPGYSFDGRGYRLGYGGGFYDVFLPGFAGVSIGLCRACQLSDRPLPRDDHDVPVDVVVTESSLVRLRGDAA